MNRYGMLINIDKCNGCYNCFMACRDELRAMIICPIPQPSPLRQVMDEDN